MRLAPGTYVLVCDAAKALLLENKGDEIRLDLRVVEAFTDEDNPSARDQASDAAGRFKTPTGVSAATEQTDWHEIGEDRFLAKVATSALAQILSSGPARMVLAADPRSLGKLRKHLADSDTLTLVAEINKDLAHQTIAQIEEAIAAA